jgi:hypothetical protein
MKKAGKLFEQREGAKGTGPPKKAQPHAVSSKRFASRRAIQPFAAIIGFLKLTRREFGAGREIFVEFVFLLCENELVPGSVTRPTGRIQ